MRIGKEIEIVTIEPAQDPVPESLPAEPVRSPAPTGPSSGPWARLVDGVSIPDASGADASVSG
jgi:hypothetical protein